MCIAKTMLKRVVSPTLKIQTREINPGALIQNPLRPSLMLRQKPSKVFDGRLRPFPSSEVLVEPSATSLTFMTEHRFCTITAQHHVR